MKIYTGAGDYGTTIRARGKGGSKDDIRVETYGTIDELNFFISLLASYVNELFLEVIQINLFKIGGYFADEIVDASVITSDEIKTLEVAIDSIESHLEPLHNFILPRRNHVVGLCHVCRTICRRA